LRGKKRLNCQEEGSGIGEKFKGERKVSKKRLPTGGRWGGGHTVCVNLHKFANRKKGQTELIKKEKGEKIEKKKHGNDEEKRRHKKKTQITSH